MKKAEAISILATSVRPREAKDRARYDKAVKMAIEALNCSEFPNNSDTISRQAAIDALHRYFDGMLETDTWSPCDVYGLIEILPSVPPDIIACGDCKHWICHDRRCGYWNHGVKPLEWCCHAERRTDGEIIPE